jgi:hypothetical protein
MNNKNSKSILAAVAVFTCGVLFGSIATFKHYEVNVGISNSISTALERSMEKAKNDPTTENIETAVYWQKVAQEIATEFADKHSTSEAG